MKFLLSSLLAIAVIGAASSALAENRGIGLGAGVFDGDFGVQIRKDFWLGGDISQITAQGAVYFENKTTFRFDADYHFILNPDNPGRFYPLVGLDIAFTSSNLELGANAGGGVNFKLTDSLQAFAEGKFIFSGWDGLAIVGGIYF